MKIRLLSAALLAGMAVAQAASAQEFDDRWYVTGSVGYNLQDEDRRTEDAYALGLGLGKFISPTWSVEGALNYQNPSFEHNSDLLWSQYGISLDLRRHFMSEERNWAPYVLFGLGYQRSEEEYDAFPDPDSPAQREDGNLAAKLGVGVQSDFSRRVAVRAELATRFDFDDQSYAAESGVDSSGYPHQQEESYFSDVIASVGVVIPLGPEPTAPVAPPPPPPPAEPAPPPPPAPITIDLNGVNFDFDRSTLRPDAVSILNEAVEILKRYPDLRVEVAGHTDLCGTDAYNQSLSERRASAVYDYLTSNGIDAGRLMGPVGYGESRPLEPTAQTLPGCKSEVNRRTELNVQN
ncbi:OmpA family protein [Luteimonas viscosa]|uniref:OmpA family protein n=1 Tax=Luteimonas viscosa TaxID=1132694 RepID=A0A5D4XL08_9GAMM|nr:OmpA family protein [Luteimonas viscosa]